VVGTGLSRPINQIEDLDAQEINVRKGQKQLSMCGPGTLVSALILCWRALPDRRICVCFQAIFSLDSHLTMPKKQQSKKNRKGSKAAKVGHASQPLSNSAFNFFRDEIFPLDLLRLVIQYLPIKDILAFNKAYQKNQFSKYLTLACSGLLVYDGKLKRTQTLIWVVSSGLLFQELAIYPNKLSLELIPKSRHTLTSIDFSDTPVTSKVIPELIQCPQLTAVNFSHCSEITTSDITSLLSSRSNWRSINISCCDVDPSALASAGSLAQLRHLNISSNDWVTDETVALIARECPNLLTIDISYTNINGNDAVRDLLLNCGELQSFQSNGVWSLTSETRMLVFATICHRQLYSSDPEQNLKATETFLDLVEHGECFSSTFTLHDFPHRPQR
jgi:hypothetical protein